MDCCFVCECEIDNASGLRVDENDEESRGCSLPECSGASESATCDNDEDDCFPNSTENAWCVAVQGTTPAHAELEKVSYDGTCFVSAGNKTLTVDTPTSACE